MLDISAETLAWLFIGLAIAITGLLGGFRHLQGNSLEQSPNEAVRMPGWLRWILIGVRAVASVGAIYFVALSIWPNFPEQLARILVPND